MIRQFFPQRGLDGLHWTDYALTSLRLLGLLALLYLGDRIGWALLGPAWFSPAWYGRTTGAFVGLLLAVLLFMLIDSPAWTSGMRQEGFNRDRAANRSAGRAAIATLPLPTSPAPGRPAPPAQRAQRAARPPAGPIADGQRQTARRAAPPAGAAVAVDDPRVREPQTRQRVDPGLCDAIVKVVTATGFQGATKTDMGDRLPSLGFDPTREELLYHLTLVTGAEGGFRVTCVRSDGPGDSRYFEPSQLKVSDDLLGKVVQVVTAAGHVSVDVEDIAAGLRRMGSQPAAPLLARVLRILLQDGVIVEDDGGYVRSGL